jgi:hypothetical protein
MNLDVGNFPRGAILEILEEAKRGEPEFGQLHYRPGAKWAREMGARNGRATR